MSENGEAASGLAVRDTRPAATTQKRFLLLAGEIERRSSLLRVTARRRYSCACCFLSMTLKRSTTIVLRSSDRAFYTGIYEYKDTAFSISKIPFAMAREAFSVSRMQSFLATSGRCTSLTVRTKASIDYFPW